MMFGALNVRFSGLISSVHMFFSPGLVYIIHYSCVSCHEFTQHDKSFLKSNTSTALTERCRVRVSIVIGREWRETSIFLIPIEL